MNFDEVIVLEIKVHVTHGLHSENVWNLNIISLLRIWQFPSWTSLILDRYICYIQRMHEWPLLRNHNFRIEGRDHNI
jgi:hypothetical protein